MVKLGMYVSSQWLGITWMTRNTSGRSTSTTVSSTVVLADPGDFVDERGLSHVGVDDGPDRL
jgi:hypothetical protein